MRDQDLLDDGSSADQPYLSIDLFLSKNSLGKCGRDVTVEPKVSKNCAKFELLSECFVFHDSYKRVSRFEYTTFEKFPIFAKTISILQVHVYLTDKEWDRSHSFESLAHGKTILIALHKLYLFERFRPDSG